MTFCLSLTELCMLFMGLNLVCFLGESVEAQDDKYFILITIP